MSFTHATSINKFTAAPLIVDPTASNGTHTTIALAIAAATSGQTILIKDGMYTEDLTLKSGINLASYECDAFNNVIINGKITVPDSTTVSISGIQLRTNSDFALVVSGSEATNVYIKDCYINALNNTAISYTSSSSDSSLNLDSCLGDVATTGIEYLSNSSAGIVRIQNCELRNSGDSLTAFSGMVSC